MVHTALNLKNVNRATTPSPDLRYNTDNNDKEIVMSKRRLILCMDGTWNSNDKSDKVTNIVKLLRAIPAVASDGISQVLYYGRGVGTGTGEKLRGGFGGAGLDDNIIDGFRFLGNNYHPGDEIYIFGFSRGAYTARSLAGLINLAGILKPVCLGGVLDELLKIYRSDQDDKQSSIAQLDNLHRHENVRIKCVGVWDTVGSLGIPGDWARQLSFASRWYFHDVHLGPHIDVALHALAIDEKRGAFPPTLWEKPINQALPPGQTVEQVWFSGVHSNIGGSYQDDRLSDITLDWMIKRLCRHTELEVSTHALNPANHPIESCIHGKGIESRSPLYITSHPYPYLRTICNVLTPPIGKVDGFIRKLFKPENSRRNLPPKHEETINEYLHISALQRWHLEQVPHDLAEDKDGPLQAYRPPNLAAVMDQVGVTGNKVPVVGWDGEILQPESVPWE